MTDSTDTAADADTRGSGATAKVDGRTARAGRTRTAIIDAQLRLVRDGDLRPTADRIAKAAGVSLRALWSHFADMEALLTESGKRVLGERDAAYVPIPADLPLADRVDAYCHQRARLLEMLAPTARASALIEPFSATLQHYRHLHVERVRSEVLATFGLEVGDDTVLLDALTSVSLWPAWATWRDAMSLTVDASLAALHRTVTALLVGRPQHLDRCATIPGMEILPGTGVALVQVGESRDVVESRTGPPEPPGAARRRCTSSTT